MFDPAVGPAQAGPPWLARQDPGPVPGNGPAPPASRLRSGCLAVLCGAWRTGAASVPARLARTGRDRHDRTTRAERMVRRNCPARGTAVPANGAQRMRIGMSLTEPTSPAALTELRDQLRQAAADGFAPTWVAHLVGLDGLTRFALSRSQEPGIEPGPARVPTDPQHPALLPLQ